MKKSN